MVKKKEDELMVQTTGEVPDYIKQGGNRGSEGVGMEDLTIPRLEIVQSLSPCRDKSDPSYIEGAEEGMLYNNVSRELYGEEVLVVPVIFKKEYLVWKDRKQGGGFRGAYDTLEDANNEITNLVESGNDANGSLEAVDTAQHLCLLINGNNLEEVAISMSRSKMKVSRQWNSLIRMTGGDRFSRVYSVRGVSDQNNDGEKFKNLMIKQVGFPSKKVYEVAEELYQTIVSGEREVKVNTDTDTDTDTDKPKKGPNF